MAVALTKEEPVFGKASDVLFADNRNESGHGRRSLHGGAVSIFARGFNAFVQIGSVFFLARLLTPEDYGLVSMVAAITGFAPSLVDLGTRDAVVQRSRISQREVSAVFWLTVAVGCVMAMLIAVAGPLIARFYREPRLTMIAVISSLTFVTSALTVQHYALLRRAMKFQEIGMIEIAANLVSATLAVVMACFGFRYWALVLRPVILTALVAVGVWARCRWIPGKAEWNKNVKEMVKFGLHSSGFTLTDFGSRSSDRVAIGYRSGARALGYYQNAFFVYDNLLDVLVSPLHNVAVASLSKVKDDLFEVKRLWGKALTTLAFYAMPAFGLLAVTGPDLIVILLGAKWAIAGGLLGVLALRGIPQTIERTLGWLHVSGGRTDRWMRWGIFAMIMQFIALLIGLHYGPRGVILAYLTTTTVLFIPAIAYAGKPMQIGAGDVVRVIWRPVLACLLAVAVAFLMRRTLLSNVPGVLRIMVLTAVFAVVYLTSVILILQVREPLVVIASLLRDAAPARFARFIKVPRFAEVRR